MFGRKTSRLPTLDEINFYEYNIVISFDSMAGKFTSHVKEMPELQLANDDWVDLYDATIEALTDVVSECIQNKTKFPLPQSFTVNETTKIVAHDYVKKSIVPEEDINKALAIERGVPAQYWDLYLECLNDKPMSKRTTDTELRDGCILTHGVFMSVYTYWLEQATNETTSK